MNAKEVADVEGTLATAGVVLLVVVAVVRVATPSGFARVRAALLGSGLALAGLVAVLATAGSLWFSEAAHFPPCELCWFQRIAMYPFAVLLAVAASRRDRAIRPYAVVLAVCGLVISAYHNVIETFPTALPGAATRTTPARSVGSRASASGPSRAWRH